MGTVKTKQKTKHSFLKTGFALGFLLLLFSWNEISFNVGLCILIFTTSYLTILTGGKND